MQNKVDLAAAQGFDGNWVREQLAKAVSNTTSPLEAVISPSTKENRVVVRVQFHGPSPFPATPGTTSSITQQQSDGVLNGQIGVSVVRT